MNCIYFISQFLKTHKYGININGKIFKVISLFEYKIHLIKLIIVIIIGILSHIIKHITYNHITIIGNTIYSKVAAYCLSQHKIPYVLCKGNNQISYYQIQETNSEIAFGGPNSQYFSKDILHPLIPHSQNIIYQLENHTKLSNLDNIQTKILSKFENKDGTYLINTKNIMQNKFNYKNPVTSIKRFSETLFYVTTIDESWISRLIITDIIQPFQPGEIITGVYGNTIEEFHDKCEIEQINEHCIIKQLNSKTTLYYQHMYKIENDLNICKIFTNQSYNQSYNQFKSLLYGLLNPRTFNKSDIKILHPFHIPNTWDPFLTIMIIIYALAS